MAEEDEQLEGENAPLRMSERQFAAHVDELADRGATGELLRLLDERQSVYAERGAAAVVRMRGWVLRALARTGLPESGLLYVLEELDNGRDAYLVASAARAIGSVGPSPRFAPYLLKALQNVRFHDDALCFDEYGGYAVDGIPATAFREVVEAIGRLGASGRSALDSLRELLPELGDTDAEAVTRAIAKIESSSDPSSSESACCSGGLNFLRELRALKTWRADERLARSDLGSVVFEDHSGARVEFDTFFRGQPSIVTFFYTRCDNPQKCSLAVHKLGNVVRLLRERGLDKRVRTAAVSYDPGWDTAERMTGYAKNRNLPFDDDHRVLRCVQGNAKLRAYFANGVNFVESLVNRHRVELYVLDAQGRIAASFERLHWEEASVVDQAAALLNEIDTEPPTSSRSKHESRLQQNSAALAGTAEPRLRLNGAKPTFHAMTGLGLAFLTAFFPKCPVCWAAYLSWFGVAELDSLRGLSPWILVALLALLGLNLASVWRRSTLLGNTLPFWTSALGAMTILVFGLGIESPMGAKVGLGISALGALTSVFGALRSVSRHARAA